MARTKLSESKAKEIVLTALGFPHTGLQITTSSLNNIEKLADKQYVIKVDQGVKGRMKKGLVKIDVAKKDIADTLEEFANMGYSQFFIDEYILHQSGEERFLSFERVREGIEAYYSKSGGINIEHAKETVKKTIVNGMTQSEIAAYLEVDKNFISKLIDIFEKNYFSFLEINPLVVKDSIVYLLDLAVEVDSTAEFFVEGKWSRADFVEGSLKKVPEEIEIEKLSAKSPAAFKLDVLNPNGSIFLLLSGGGASLVLADEVYNKGLGKELANYGEYSGNPTAEETFIYTKNLLSLLIKSTSPKKILIIGGGVANFTDIRITFSGIIKALDESSNVLQKQNVKVFVRRGGPHQKEGLAMLSTFLKKKELFGDVHGPEVVLTSIISEAISHLSK